jgi:hypothetical protein
MSHMYIDVTYCSSPDSPVTQSGQNLRFPELIAVCCASLTRSRVVAQSVHKQIALWLSKELSGFGAVGEDLPDDQSQSDRDKALNEKDPLPACKTGSSIELLDAICKETAESTSERRAHVEDSHAALNFEAAVPDGEKKRCCREETSLSYIRSISII